MTTESYYKATDLLRTRRWLEEIRDDYEKAARLIRESPEDAILNNSSIAIRTGVRTGIVDLNCHRPVKCGGLLQAFEAAAASIKAKIEEIDKEIAAL